VRDPAAAVDFWLEHNAAFERIRVAQARVDALNTDETSLTKEEPPPAIDEPVKPAEMEVAPPAAPSSSPDDEEKLSADALTRGVYVPNPDVLGECLDTIADVAEHEPAQVGRLEIEEGYRPHDRPPKKAALGEPSTMPSTMRIMGGRSSPVIQKQRSHLHDAKGIPTPASRSTAQVGESRPRPTSA
jgi:hypothetical protein